MDELVTIKAPTADSTSSFSKCDADIAGGSPVTFRLGYRRKQHQLQAPMQAGSIPIPGACVGLRQTDGGMGGGGRGMMEVLGVGWQSWQMASRASCRQGEELVAAS